MEDVACAVDDGDEEKASPKERPAAKLARCKRKRQRKPARMKPLGHLELVRGPRGPSEAPQRSMPGIAVAPQQKIGSALSTEGEGIERFSPTLLCALRSAARERFEGGPKEGAHFTRIQALPHSPAHAADGLVQLTLRDADEAEDELCAIR